MHHLGLLLLFSIFSSLLPQGTITTRAANVMQYQAQPSVSVELPVALDNSVKLFQLWLPTLSKGAPEVRTVTAVGGQLHWQEQGVTLSVPPGAVTGPTRILLAALAESPATNETQGISAAFTLSAQTTDGAAMSQFAQPVTLRVQLDPPAGRALADFSLFALKPADSRWVELSMIDRTAGVLAANTVQLGGFAAMLRAAPSQEPPVPVPPPTPTPNPCPAEVDPDFLNTFMRAESAGEKPVCAKDVSYDLNGFKAQDFQNGATIVANWYIGAGYIDGYKNNGTK